MIGMKLVDLGLAKEHFQLRALLALLFSKLFKP